MLIGNQPVIHDQTPSQPNNVVSFSGGKDSTAMTLLMLEKGEPIHSLVAFDTGWEFPQMYEHWDKFERYSGLKITILRPSKPFDYWLTQHPVRFKSGEKKGEVRWIGRKWPDAGHRWCTAEKTASIRKYLNTVEDVVSCVGIAADEAHRAKIDPKHTERYPLIEWNVDEQFALELCYRHGFDWAGLYGLFKRVSCYCCPLQRIGELRKVRKHFPDLWARMLELDGVIDGNRGFRGYDTVHDLEAIFAESDRWRPLPMSFQQNNTISI